MTFGIDKYEKAADNAAFLLCIFYLKRDGNAMEFFYNQDEITLKGVESTC
ncbi:hypothetical protein [Bacillus rhizoplanae]